MSPPARSTTSSTMPNCVSNWTPMPLPSCRHFTTGHRARPSWPNTWPRWAPRCPNCPPSITTSPTWAESASRRPSGCPSFSAKCPTSPQSNSPTKTWLSWPVRSECSTAKSSSTRVTRTQFSLPLQLGPMHSSVPCTTCPMKCSGTTKLLMLLTRETGKLLEKNKDSSPIRSKKFFPAMASSQTSKWKWTHLPTSTFRSAQHGLLCTTSEFVEMQKHCWPEFSRRIKGEGHSLWRERTDNFGRLKLLQDESLDWIDGEVECIFKWETGRPSTSRVRAAGGGGTARIGEMPRKCLQGERERHSKWIRLVCLYELLPELHLNCNWQLCSMKQWVVDGKTVWKRNKEELRTRT